MIEIKCVRIKSLLYFFQQHISLLLKGKNYVFYIFVDTFIYNVLHRYPCNPRYLMHFLIRKYIKVNIL